MGPDLFLAVGGLALLAAALWLTFYANRRGGGEDQRLAAEAERSRETTRALAAQRGWRVVEGAELADRRPPAQLEAELATMTECLALVDGVPDGAPEGTSDGASGGFVAETWAGSHRRLGAALSYGLLQHVLRVPAPGVTASLVAGPVPGPYDPVILPRMFKGDLAQGVQGRMLAGGDYAELADLLDPVLPGILAEGCWLVVHDGEVVLTGLGEPDAARLERRLSSARDVAARLSGIAGQV